jgi:hypothetical protein
VILQASPGTVTSKTGQSYWLQAVVPHISLLNFPLRSLLYIDGIQSLFKARSISVTTPTTRPGTESPKHAASSLSNKLLMPRRARLPRFRMRMLAQLNLQSFLGTHAPLYDFLTLMHRFLSTLFILSILDATLFKLVLRTLLYTGMQS